MRPKFPHLNLSRAMLDWRCVQSLILCLLGQTYLVQYWIEDASKISSLEPFLCNTGLKMRPKFNTVSSQPDLSCAILDWRCILKFYTVLSVGPFSCNARLEMRPKFLYCVFSVGPFLYNAWLKMRPRLCLLSEVAFPDSLWILFCLLLPYSPVFCSGLQKFS